jgi:hypothetical protein
MASAKGGGTTRRSRSSKTPKKNDQPEVSPARWAGVALVIAAIVGAVFLAVISPSDTDEPAQPGAQVAEVESTGLIDDASPSPTVLDVAVPVVAPDIVVPKSGMRTGEYEFAVTVAVPDDRTVKRQYLDLHIYNNGKHAKAIEKPKPGTEVKVDGVRLTPGDNVLTAVLSSPTGPGPTSDAITVVLDDEIPPLEIVSPKNKLQTYEEKVTVEVTSEVDASVTIDNTANDHDVMVTIGPAGKASQSIRLKYGKNVIEATSVDEAGQDRDDSVTVIRLDGRPKIKLKFPESVNPPEKVRLVAEVKDAKKQPMKDADVLFTLTASNMSTLTDPSKTNAKGRAVWEVEIPASSSPAETLELGVTVTSPTGDKDRASGTIKVK